MMVRLLALTAATLIAALPLAAIAQPISPARAHQDGCQLRISGASSNWIIRGFDPFGNDASFSTFDLTFSNEGDEPCRFSPVISTEGEPFGLVSASGHRIRYSIFDNTNSYDATPLSGGTLLPPRQHQIVVPPRQQRVVTYQLRVGADEISEDGLYAQGIVIRAQTAEGTTLASRQSTVGLDVAPSAAVGLSGAFKSDSGRAVVNLGELMEGTARTPLALRVSSTRSYRIDVSSQNSGYLVLNGSEWKVPYQVSIGEQVVSLSGGGGHFSKQARGMIRESLPFAFIIGDVSGRRAGYYSDTLTISISAD